MVITVCDLVEKFECAGKFTMCGNNVTRKYWLIADRPNEAKNMWPFFAPCPDFMTSSILAFSDDATTQKQVF